jgi:hypothetical protein
MAFYLIVLEAGGSRTKDNICLLLYLIVLDISDVLLFVCISKEEAERPETMQEVPEPKRTVVKLST